MWFCSQDWRADGTSASWMECATGWIKNNTRTLANATWTASFIKFSSGNNLYRLYRRFSNWKWARLMGFLIVSFNPIKINIVGIWIIIFKLNFRAKSLRTPSNVFVINLAFCDFIMMTKAPMFIYNSFKQGYALGPFWCQIFALVGSFSGIGASMSNVFIAMDRYNVITNPLEGKLTMPKAIFFVILIWCYTTPWALFPYFQIWGRFVPGRYRISIIFQDRLLEVHFFHFSEGYLTACTFDYLTDTFDNQLFVAAIFTFSYAIPMLLIMFFYSQIVKHIFSHEKTLRAQAKKMNVESLRSNKAGVESAEIRIAKAAITVCFLFVASWTPYGKQIKSFLFLQWLFAMKNFHTFLNRCNGFNRSLWE